MWQIVAKLKRKKNTEEIQNLLILDFLVVSIKIFCLFL